MKCSGTGNTSVEWRRARQNYCIDYRTFDLDLRGKVCWSFNLCK